MIQWRVYFDDGTCEDSSSSTVESVRGDGVQVIVQRDDAPGDPYAVGRELLFDADYYCWRDERWFRCDLRGLFDYLHAPGWKKTLSGRTAHRTAYKLALMRAQLDADFPLKSARQAGEARLSDA